MRIGRGWRIIDVFCGKKRKGKKWKRMKMKTRFVKLLDSCIEKREEGR